MSDRKAITEGLSKLLEKRLDSEHRKWAREVKFSNPECRADFVAFKPHWYMNGGGIGGIERGTVSFYEVKSCIADYNSGHGLNFYGDENWLVCPIELSMKMRGQLPYGVGIYIPVPNGSNKYKQFDNPVPYTGETDGWSLHVQCEPSHESYRRHSLTEVLVAMIYAKF